MDDRLTRSSTPSSCGGRGGTRPLSSLAKQGTGPARIIDDGSPEVAGERIRLDGADATESRQIGLIDRKRGQCGKDAFKRNRRSLSRPPFD